MMKLKPRWKEACLASVVITGAWKSMCYADEPLILDIEPPAGFESSGEPRQIFADIYYDHRYLTTQLIIFTDEWVKLDNPKQIVDKIPDITAPELIFAALQKDLNPHKSKLCLTETQKECGYLLPEVAGIILDEANLRLSLFINPDYLKWTAAKDNIFLPPSDADKSFIQKVNGLVSGIRGAKQEQSTRSGDNKKNRSYHYTLTGRSLLAFKENNFQANYDYSDKNNFSMGSAFFDREFEGKMWQAGLLTTHGFGMSFSGDQTLWGARLASSVNTRTDQALGQSSSVQLFMPVRGSINVLKDGRLIYTAFKSAGNYFLDTTNFDSGAYNITVQIRDSNGNLISEETRFFVKDYALPKKGAPAFFLEGGRVVNRDTATVLPKTTGNYLFRAGINYRIAADWGGSAVVAATQKRHFSELTLFNMGEHYKISPGILLTVDGSLGSKIDSHFYWKNITAYFSHKNLHNRKNKRELTTGVNTFRLLENSLNQSNFGISLPLFKGALSYDMTRRSQKGLKNLNMKSLNYAYNILKDKDHMVNARFSYSQSNSGNKLYQLILELRLNDGHMTHGMTSLGSLRKNSNSQENRINRDNNLRYDFNWHNTQDSAHDADAHLTAQKNKEQAILTGSGNIYSDYGHFSGAVSHNFNKDNTNTTNYSANFTTHFATGGNGYSVGGYHYQDSGLIVNMQGIGSKDYFNVMVNGKKEGVAHGKWNSMIPLSPFATYDITLSPINRGFYRFNETARKVTLYPGNVVSMDYHVQSFRVFFGQVLDENGKFLTNAQIKDNAALINTTNEYGIFQTELPYATKSVMFTKEGKSCMVLLPEGRDDQEMINIGTVQCKPLSK